MANGNIVGVEPLPALGAYRAKLADGSSMMLTGPTGESIYKRYGQNALGPNALASNGAPPAEPGTASDAPRTASMSLSALRDMRGKSPEEVRQIAAQNPISVNGQPASLGVAEASAAAQPTQQASAAHAVPGAAMGAAPPSGPTPLGYQMKGIDPATGKEISGPAIRDADGSIKIYVPGVAGRPGGMTKLGKEALEHDAAAEAELTKQRGLEEQARQMGTDAAKQEAEERSAYLDEQKVQAMLQIQQQQDEQAKVQSRVGELQGKYDKARDDFMNSKVDPDQYMKSGGGATAIFSTLGMMLGAFGATLGRTQNFAQEFTQGQIERHIRAQEAAINVKGKAADNMLADLTRETGSLQNGKLAMRQMLLEKASIEAQQIGAKSKSQAIAAEANKTAAQLAGQAAIVDNARKQSFLEHVMSNPLYYQRGSAGRTAGFVQPTQAAVESAAGAGIAAEKLALDKQKAEIEAAKTKAGANVPEAAKKSLAELDSAIAGLDRMDQHDKGGYALFTGGGTVADKDEQQLASDANSVGPGVARAIEGDAATKDSMEAAKSGLASHSAAQRKAAREAYREQLLEKRAAVVKQMGQ